MSDSIHLRLFPRAVPVDRIQVGEAVERVAPFVICGAGTVRAVPAAFV